MSRSSTSLRSTATCAASFWPKKAQVGADDFEQLRHHRRHAAEMSGTRCAVELVAQALDQHIGLRAGGIHLLRPGREQQVDAQLLQQRSIAFQGARILGQIFRRAELQRIDEDGNRGHVAARLRRAHQRQMAFVQSAHGGHESQGLAVAGHLTASCLHLGDGCNAFHGWCALVARRRRFRRWSRLLGCVVLVRSRRRFRLGQHPALQHARKYRFQARQIFRRTFQRDRIDLADRGLE